MLEPNEVFFRTMAMAAGAPTTGFLPSRTVRADAMDRVDARLSGMWSVNLAVDPLYWVGLVATPGCSICTLATTLRLRDSKGPAWGKYPKVTPQFYAGSASLEPLHSQISRSDFQL